MYVANALYVRIYGDVEASTPPVVSPPRERVVRALVNASLSFTGIVRAGSNTARNELYALEHLVRHARWNFDDSLRRH